MVIWQCSCTVGVSHSHLIVQFYSCVSFYGGTLFVCHCWQTVIDLHCDKTHTTDSVSCFYYCFLLSALHLLLFPFFVFTVSFVLASLCSFHSSVDVCLCTAAHTFVRNCSLPLAICSIPRWPSSLHHADGMYIIHHTRYRLHSFTFSTIHYLLT